MNDAFPNWMLGSGLFSELESLNVPWKGEGLAESLDYEYFGNHSGDKTCSPLVQKLANDVALTDDAIDKLCKVIIAVNGLNWSKLYATRNFDYEPIENYNMVEESTGSAEMTYGKTSTRTDNLDHTKTGTETHATSQDVTTTPNLTNTQTQTVNGFNSSTGVQSGGVSPSASGTSKEEGTGSNTITFDTIDSDSGTQDYSTGGSDKNTSSNTLTRHGNIGVTTSQQMIQSERDLWTWNFFNTVVFPDCDKILTLSIY